VFNSVFKKLTFVYFIVILLTLIILGTSMVKMFENFYFSEREEALTKEGKNLNTTIVKYLNHEVGYEKLETELESIERYLNAKVWVIDRLGYVYGTSSASERKWIGRQLTQRDIDIVLSGSIIKKRGAYDEYFESPVMTVGVPIFVNGEVVTGIFMHSPIYEIDDALRETYKIIFYSLGICLLLVTALIYIISQRISKPILEMNRITKTIASGEFNKRISINSKDEIGQLAESFNYMAQELNKLEEMRKGFVADVSHELRSPLTLIKGYVKGLMAMDLTDEKRQKYLDIIYEETDRLSELISNLLDLSRMDYGESTLNKSKFDINELIRRTIVKYSNKLEEKDIEVDASFESDPLFVIAEKESIFQVLSNIVDNSIKFMSSKDNLTIKTEIVNDKVLISIRDTGKGIAEEDIKNIWQRFYKGDKSRSRQTRGTGLGLSIVKEIIKSHNEKIWVESKVGEGTKFIFTLTIADKIET